MTVGEVNDHVESADCYRDLELLRSQSAPQSLALDSWITTPCRTGVILLTLVLNKPPADPLRAQSARNRLAASPVFFA